MSSPAGVGEAARRRAIVALIGAGIVILALLTVFAIELASTQARSRSAVTDRVHERSVLAGALIDSLFQTVEQQIPQYQQRYGARVMSGRAMDAYAQQAAYLALVDRAGRVLASSRRFTSQARADLARSAALALVRSGHRYGLGNVLPYGRSGVVNLAVAFPTGYAERILLTGFQPPALTPFLDGELRKIPGVRGSHNYVIDGNGTVLASTDPARRSGYRFSTPAERAALTRTSLDTHGTYYDQARLANSTWRIVLAAPDGPLFAGISGLPEWLPWLIFAAFALVAAAALALGARVVRSLTMRCTIRSPVSPTAPCSWIASSRCSSAQAATPRSAARCCSSTSTVSSWSTTASATASATNSWSRSLAGSGTCFGRRSAPPASRPRYFDSRSPRAR